MQEWMTRIGRTLMMGLAWAVVWVPIGMVAGRLIVGELEPEHVGGPLYAGLLSGAMFAVVAGIASGRRRLDELSLSQAAAWGALSGLLIGVLPFVLGDQHGSDRPLWILPVVVIGSMTVFCALSASVSLPIARWMNRSLEASASR